MRRGTSGKEIGESGDSKQMEKQSTEVGRRVRSESGSVWIREGKREKCGLHFGHAEIEVLLEHPNKDAQGKKRKFMSTAKEKIQGETVGWGVMTTQLQEH